MLPRLHRRHVLKLQTTTNYSAKSMDSGYTDHKWNQQHTTCIVIAMDTKAFQWDRLSPVYPLSNRKPIKSRVTCISSPSFSLMASTLCCPRTPANSSLAVCSALNAASCATLWVTAFALRSSASSLDQEFSTIFTESHSLREHATHRCILHVGIL